MVMTYQPGWNAAFFTFAALNPEKSIFDVFHQLPLFKKRFTSVHCILINGEILMSHLKIKSERMPTILGA